MPEVEKSTNQVYRKKYFVDAAQILSGGKGPRKARAKAVSPILQASHVAVSDKVVQLSSDMRKIADHIRVDVIKDGNRIKKIRISCPCGRTADLDCEYSEA